MDMLLTYIDTILESKPFKNFSKDELLSTLKYKNYRFSSYNTEDVIFMEGEPCLNFSIILKGAVEIQKIDPSGKVLKVATFGVGDVFGENLIFGERSTYPMMVMSKCSSLILHLSKDSMVKLCEENPKFLFQFLKVQSNKAQTLSSKIKEVTLKTIRQKICEFLVEEYEESGDTTIKLPMSKKNWADSLGVQRPSLSRELIKLKEEGLIDYDKEYIYIKDIDSLEDFI